MERRTDSGLFEVEVDQPIEELQYRLHARGRDAGEREFEDPYRFLPVIANEHLQRFRAGVEWRAWHFLGARPLVHQGVSGFCFAVWAPNASAVSVVADFNRFDARIHPMRNRGDSGVWELFVPGCEAGACYKFSIVGAENRREERADPYGRAMEMRPHSASVTVGESTHAWQDQEWMATARRDLSAPMSIYEVHLGSWRRADDPGGFRRWLSYRELARELVPYAADLGFTHLELMPITEHPFDGSWGYQTLGYFAPTSRFGSPDDFRFFVDEAHRHGLGIILDWVPAHFPRDGHGLARFDGTHLYEHSDPRRGAHPDWGTLVFNYARNEVQSFLVSSALYWLEEFHLDGLRVDAVASMLYLDYSREPGQWVANEYGGRENLDALAFLRYLNDAVHAQVPRAWVIAEESTAWPGVSGDTSGGGLGFDLKWNMGWMNDTLKYFERDPLHRKHHHQELTFSLIYAFHERFLLPFSHDEVVHGKSAMVTKLPGFDVDRFATLRMLYAYLWTHPGKKLLFMGGELAQWSEWNHDSELEWSLLDWEPHRQVHQFVRNLNRIYRTRRSLHEVDFDENGFEWIDADDGDRGTLSYLRWSRDWQEVTCVAMNLTPVPRAGYRLGLPFGGAWQVLANSSRSEVGGGPEILTAEASEAAGRPFSLSFDLPPLSAVIVGTEGSASDSESA
jgi:1,4-alpha-glucan branching enzyme